MIELKWRRRWPAPASSRPSLWARLRATPIRRPGGARDLSAGGSAAAATAPSRRRATISAASRDRLRSTLPPRARPLIAPAARTACAARPARSSSGSRRACRCRRRTGTRRRCANVMAGKTLIVRRMPSSARGALRHVRDVAVERQHEAGDRAAEAQPRLEGEDDGREHDRRSRGAPSSTPRSPRRRPSSPTAAGW